MLNGLFAFLVGFAVIVAAFNGQMPRLTEGAMADANRAVQLAISLVGQMALWLGLMGIVREAGLTATIARALRPVMQRLFPDVPPEHPAMGAMILNLAANLLGLANAATPFGLKAMSELDKLNPRRGVATDAMALFLAINTSGVTLLSLQVIGLRVALGSRDPGGVLVPTLLATALSTLAAVLITKALERLPRYSPGMLRPTVDPTVDEKGPPAGAPSPELLPEARASGARRLLLPLLGAALVAALARQVWLAPVSMSAFDRLRGLLSEWLLPCLIASILVLGVSRRVKVYEVFVAGAKEGFQIAITVIPFLVAILVAIGMFRASGAMELFVSAIAPVTALVGFPAEALPMALVRPLSGQGSLGVLADTMRAHGPDSFIGYLVSVINGSSETTFYVLALYYGSVQVKATRHTLPACLAADLAGVAASLVVCRLFFSS